MVLRQVQAEAFNGERELRLREVACVTLQVAKKLESLLLAVVLHDISTRRCAVAAECAVFAFDFETTQTPSSPRWYCQFVVALADFFALYIFDACRFTCSADL